MSRREPALRFEWERILRRVIVPATVKHVGLTLATFADMDGTNARPSVERLAATTCLGERTVRRALAVLRDVGLVERTFCGSSMGRQARCDEYRLVVPDDLFDRVPLLGPAELQVEGSPVIPTGDLPGSPVTVACVPGGGNPVHDTRSPVIVASDRRITPVTDARTPVTDDRNTGHSDRPQEHDQLITTIRVAVLTPEPGIPRARAASP